MPTEIKADGQRGWYKLSRDISAALCSLKLGGCEHAVLHAIFLYSYGLPAPSSVSSLTARTLPSVLPYAARQVYNAREKLTERNIVYATGKGHLYINTLISAWEGLDLAHLARVREPFENLQRPADLNNSMRKESSADRRPTEAASGREVPASRKDLSSQAERNCRVAGVFETEKRNQHHHIDTNPLTDPHSWLVKRCLGFAMKLGMPEGKAKQMVTALAGRIYRDGGTIDAERFCDALHGVIQAWLDGRCDNPPGAAIDSYQRGTFAPDYPGRLWRHLVKEQAKSEKVVEPVPVSTEDRENATQWWQSLSVAERSRIADGASRKDRKDLLDCLGGPIPDWAMGAVVQAWKRIPEGAGAR